MKIYKTLLIAFMMLAYINGYGQLKITGIISDTTKRPLPDASIKLMMENKLLQTTFSNEKGEFSFLPVVPGSYEVLANFVGSKENRMAFNLTTDTVLTLLVKNIAEVMLKDVTIIADKPLIERKIDRIVFNVGNSIAAKGTDLSQALSLTPMLRVDVNGVSIVGKSGVSIMINERIVNIAGSDLINYLKSLRSDDVEKIEIITTPPAKYEAQGNSGMINIVLKKNPNVGWSGNVSLTYAQTTYGAVAGSANLNYQSKKISSSLKVRQNYRLTRPTEIIDIIGSNSILSSDVRKDTERGLGANLSVDYKSSEKANLGFIYDIGKTNYLMAIDNVSVYRTLNQTDSILSTGSNQENPAVSQTLNIYWDQKIGKKGKKLSTGFNYFSTLPNTNVDFTTISNLNPVTEQVRNTSVLNYNIWSVQSDLTLPYQWALMELGTKFTKFGNNSDIGYYNKVNGDLNIDESKSNQFDYDEQNLAAYLSMQRNLGKKWSVKGGIRYEYSIISGYSPKNNEENKVDYGRFFPSLYLSYKASDNHTLSFTYSKRINRPNFRALNPFRWYSNPYTYSTGNPQLQPSYNHNTEVSYLYKGIFSLTLYMQKLINGYGRITEVNNALKVVNYQNYLTQYNSGLEATFGLKFFPWWENREFLSFNFAHAKSAIADVVLEDGSALYYSTYNTFVLNKSWSLFVNFWHALPAKQGNVYSESRTSLASGIRFTMADGKLQFNAAGDDILKGTMSRGKLYYSNFTQYYNNYYDSRRFSLTMTYTFGKAKVRGNKKTVNFKETQRAN
ncbi:outer membrane beta-barrel family protein [uncultured Pedobacter sp.]|uniref:outer membrane beta-barrel family protein n=1 Tax=uncultured Pedobacter sp. TaxID=246139 RepID=UPI0025F6F738|nr:outer membrane beta-barrel family protein [uncultured Pedobacter sp.]